MIRRTFLKQAGLTCAGFALPLAGWRPTPHAQETPITFGVIADVHQDIMHDGKDRLRAFVQTMQQVQPDFILQLGDFCVPHERNDAFMSVWRSFQGPRYHVIGNHDTDGGYTREQTVSYYGMLARYYSFDHEALHVVVLDGNDKGGVLEGYPRFIAQDQVEWLKADLAKTNRPTIVFIHQPLDNVDGVENRAQIRQVLEGANENAGWNKVLAVFAGHSHVDYARQIKGIYYVMINSSSYQWVGGQHKHQSYSEEIHQRAPWLDHTCPYRDPIWAHVTLNMQDKVMTIKGRKTRWMGKSPAELGADFENEYWGWDPQYSVPRISDWHAPINTQNGDLGN